MILTSAVAVAASSGAASAPDTLAFVSSVTNTLTLTSTGLVQQPLLRARNVTAFTWSPDGSRIAFVDGDGNIAISAVDGSDRRALTQVQPEHRLAEYLQGQLAALVVEVHPSGRDPRRHYVLRGAGDVSGECGHIHPGEQWLQGAPPG